MRLTTSGETLLAHADGIFARIEAAEAELEAIAGLRGGRLRMASFPTAGATLMPLAIARFRHAHPDVELTLAEGEPKKSSRACAAESSTSRSSSSSKAPANRSVRRLARTDLLEDGLYLALPGDHRLAANKSLRLEDLRDEAWIQTSESSPCARHVVRCCHAAGFEPQVSFESDDYLTIQGLVAAGVGVGLIPGLALSSVRDDIIIRSLTPSNPVRNILAATPSATRAPPAAAAMLSVLKEAAAQYAVADLRAFARSR